MRVISGKYKGKNIKGFENVGTRPTKDRVKESIFGSIQSKIKGSVFLDLFAGTGSIGIEALSNGASKAYFVDNGKDILKVLKENTKDIESSVIVSDDFLSALKNFSLNHISFDIIFIDPPYHLNYLNKALNLIKEYKLLNNNGIVICEYEEEIPDEIYPLLKEKKYGKTYVKIFRN